MLNQEHTVTELDPVVHIVDSHADARELIAALLNSVSIRTDLHADAAEFLDSYQPEVPGCLLLDLRLPGMDGLELQQLLQVRQMHIPIIFVSGHGDMDVVIRALKRGAVDFIAKPFSEQRLLESVKSGLARDARQRARLDIHHEAEARLSGLTRRERDVLHLLLEGKSNKMIATELGLSHKTVEFHRSRIMMKSRSNSLADLVRISMLADQMCEFEAVA